MSPLAQVLHVARKDLRESRWPFIVYVAIVLLATVNAMSASPLGAFIVTPMFLVVIAGVILVALLIQADSPVRDDAFWATHPLHPLAVLAAKALLAVVVIVGVPLVGQALALAANDVHGMDLLRLLPSSALTYSFWLLIAVVFAAFTRDLKTFVVALVCIPVVVAMGLAILFLRGEPTSISQSSSSMVIATRIAGWLGLIGCFALVVQLYAARFIGRFAWFVAVPVGACLVFGFLGAFVSASRPDWVRVHAPTMPVSVSIRDTDPRNLASNSSLDIDVKVPPIPAGRRLTLVPSSIVLELKDGTNLRLRVSPGTDLGLVRPQLPGVAWRASNADSLPVAHLNANLDFTQRQAIQQGIVKVSLSGMLIASVPRVAGNLKLVSGASSVSRGQRLRLESWRFGAGVASLTLHTWSIRLFDAPPDFFGFPSAVRYALVNDRRHDAVPLTNSGSGGSSSWLVLPGVDVEAWSRTLETRPTFPQSASDGLMSDDWFRGAHLVVFDWVPVARYAVSAESAVP